MRGQRVRDRATCGDRLWTIQIPFDDHRLREAAEELPYAQQFPNGGIAFVPIETEHDGGRLIHVRVEYIPCVTWKLDPHPLGLLGPVRDIPERLADLIILKVIADAARSTIASFLADAAVSTCALDEQPWRC